VTAVGSTSFAGLCRLPSGETRSIDASWELLDDGTVSGTIRSARA